MLSPSKTKHRAFMYTDVSRDFVGDPRVRKKKCEFLIGILLSSLSWLSFSYFTLPLIDGEVHCNILLSSEFVYIKF